MLAAGGALIIQTIHPLGTREGVYADGWRTETFAEMPGEWPEAMPWYFRTLGSWHRLLTTAGYGVSRIVEPMVPDGVTPASIVFVCRHTPDALVLSR
jgi:hypothetical protein